MENKIATETILKTLGKEYLKTGLEVAVKAWEEFLATT